MSNTHSIAHIILLCAAVVLFAVGAYTGNGRFAWAGGSFLSASFLPL